MRHFTIIGGGATGTLLAVNLIKNNGNYPLTVNLVERKARVGRGVAYSTTNDLHLLNVPANKMGAFPDDVGSFHQWLVKNNYNYLPNDFVPRRIFGEYLQNLLEETIKNADKNVTVNLVNQEAVDVTLENNQAQVILDSGETLPSDKVILAFGNFLPPHPGMENNDFVFADKYFQNPWNGAVARKISGGDDVLIIGTGLTMVDTVLGFFNTKHRGKIFAVSKHGWLPAVHKLGFVYPSFSDELKAKNKVSELFKIVRRRTAQAENAHSNWRGVIDSLRPATQEMWVNLPDAEKRRFMRHLRRIWDVSRHRMPEECAEILQKMQDAGQLEILKGRIKKIEQSSLEGFNITYESGAEKRHIHVNAVVNCTGSESDFSKIESPLVQNLLCKNYIQTDNLALGLAAQPNGKISDVFYTIGTSLKGILWESTAMPEIRTQAHNLARQLLNEKST